VIAAEGEQKASHALKQAADVIQESPAALQVTTVMDNTMTQVLKYYYRSEKGISSCFYRDGY
jgi:hypothetical protein